MSNYGPTTHRQSEASRWRMPHRHGLKPQQKWPTSKKNIPTTVEEKARTSNRTSQTMEEWPVWKKRTCLCADGWDISTESDISTAAFILTNRANLWADYAVALWHIHNCYWQLESLLFLNPPCPFALRRGGANGRKTRTQTNLQLLAVEFVFMGNGLVDSRNNCITRQ